MWTTTVGAGLALGSAMPEDLPEARSMPAVVTRMLRGAALSILASLAITSLPHSAQGGGWTPAAAVGLAATVVAARWRANLTVIMALGIGAYAATGALTG